MFKKKKQQSNNRGSQARKPATVFSYYSTRQSSNVQSSSQTRQPRNDQQTKQGIVTILPSLLAMFVIVACVLYATSLDSQPRIQINSSTNKQLLRDSNFYQKAGGKIIQSSIFNRSKLTIDTNGVAAELEGEYPELGKVSVIIPLVSRRPIIEVQPAQAMIRLTGSSGSFIVDEQGRVLVKGADATSRVRDSLPNVIDESGLKLELGKQVLPITVVDFINQLASQLNAKHITSQSLTLPAIANELHLRVEGTTYYVKFDLQGDPRQQAGAYLAAKEKFETDKTTPSEYLDVRVPEKVFYK